jgi:DMSO/TMAO reductase YedYZ molybdopterin-dependent catalytic subunit
VHARLLVTLAFIVGTSVHPVAFAQAPPVPVVTISGSVAKTLTLEMAQIERCAPHEVDIRVRADAASGPTIRRYTGCRLRDIVRQAEPVEARPRDLRRSYILATAADGHQVLFSWAEVFLTSVGDDILVAFRRDGQPLRDGEGPVAIVSGADTGAARHVKHLTSIELRSAGR